MLIKADYYLLYCTKKEVRGKIIINIKRTSVDESGSRRFTVIMGARSNFFEVKKGKEEEEEEKSVIRKSVFKCVQGRREGKKCVNRSEEKRSAVRRRSGGTRGNRCKGYRQGRKVRILRIGTMHARTHIW